MKQASFQFSLRRIFLVTLVYALLFALLFSLPLPAAALAAATCVFTAFVAVDLAWGAPPDSSNSPAWRHAALFASCYSTALSLAAITCLFVSTAIESHQPPPAPISALELLSLEWLRAALRPLAIALSLVLTYIIFGIAGFLTALAALRHFRLAYLFLLLNSPAIVIIAWSTADSWRGSS